MTDQTFNFDIAARNDLGTRARQEDCVAVRFCSASQAGLAVLADGMGGHQDGGLASKFLVTGVASELMQDLERFAELAPLLPEKLKSLTNFANLQLRKTIEKRNINGTVGATLVSAAVVADKVYWASVGDSPLFLYRDDKLERLNADHSMSQQIDFMVDAGMISAEVAANHPDRNVLTSAIRGKDVPKIDCPDEGFQLIVGDMLILASDGLNVLNTDEIAAVLRKRKHLSGERIADALIDAVRANSADKKDNTAFAVIKMNPADGTTDDA